MKPSYLACAALALAACNSNGAASNRDAATDAAVQSSMGTATDATTATAAATTQPTDAVAYLAAAGAGDQWEIESSRAVMAKTGSADVRAFAQMMIDNHTASTKKLTAAAQSANLSMGAPMMTTDQQRMLDEIRSAGKADVDQVYWRNQKMAHEQALALHSEYAANGDMAELKSAAGEIVPVVRKHIAELNRKGTAATPTERTQSPGM